MGLRGFSRFVKSSLCCIVPRPLQPGRGPNFALPLEFALLRYWGEPVLMDVACIHPILPCVYIKSLLATITNLTLLFLLNIFTSKTRQSNKTSLQFLSIAVHP